MQLQRAMLLAHEQLVQSTEDLTIGQKALNWNRFTHSQDSLDKVKFAASQTLLWLLTLFNNLCGIGVHGPEIILRQTSRYAKHSVTAAYSNVSNI